MDRISWRTELVRDTEILELLIIIVVYISESGKVICDYLQPKKILDTVQLVYKGRDKPIEVLYHRFNEENDIDSLFSPGGTSALMSAVSGLDNFELICYLVVK